MLTMYDNIPIGVQGENLSRPLQIDVSELVSAFPSATIKLYVQRPVDSVPYEAANTSVTGSVMTYTPDATDTAVAGKVQLQMSAVTGSTVLKTLIGHGWVDESLSGNVSPEPPDAVQAWIDALQEDKAWADKLQNVEASVETLDEDDPATVTVTQTSDTTTFAFGIPAGATGPQGPQGPQGPTGPEGPAGPSITINDSTISTATSWSSSKINSEIGGFIDDTDTALGTTWSSNKIAGSIADLIADGSTASDSTWSSTKLAADLALKMAADFIDIGDEPCNYIRIGTVVVAWGSVSVSSSANDYPTAHEGLFGETPSISIQWAKTGEYSTGDWGVPKVYAQTADGFSVRSGTSSVSGHTCRWIAIGFAPSN